MRWSDLPLRPPAATLRSFAVCASLVLTGFAASEYFRHDNAILALSLATGAAAVLAIGIAAPRLLRPVFVVLLVVTFPIGWLVMHLLLAGVFYCVFTPLGLFFRLIGRDALARRFEPARESYWTAKPTADDLRRYFRPF